MWTADAKVCLKDFTGPLTRPLPCFWVAPLRTTDCHIQLFWVGVLLYISWFYILCNCATLRDLANCPSGTNKVIWLELNWIECWQAYARRPTLPSQYVTAWPGAFKQVQPHTKNEHTSSLSSSYLPAAHRPAYPDWFCTATFSGILFSFLFYFLCLSPLFSMRHIVCCVTVFHQSRCCSSVCSWKNLHLLVIKVSGEWFCEKPEWLKHFTEWM